MPSRLRFDFYRFLTIGGLRVVAMPEGIPRSHARQEFSVLNQTQVIEEPISIKEIKGVFSKEDVEQTFRYLKYAEYSHRSLKGSVLPKLVASLKHGIWQAKLLQVLDDNPYILDSVFRANSDLSSFLELDYADLAEYNKGILASIKLVLVILDGIEGSDSLGQLTSSFTRAQYIVLIRKHLSLADNFDLEIDWKFLGI